MCPFKRSTCGPTSDVKFYDVGDDAAVHIKDLPKGQACTYNVESRCGAPSFTIKNSTGVTVYYTEWQQNKIKPVTPVTELEMSDSKVLAASPLESMPPRSTKFVQFGSQTELSEAGYGTYTKNGWKTWGNLMTDGSEDGKIGRRYQSTDQTCSMRNMLIAVVATGDDAQLLLEMESRKFLATYLRSAAAVTVASLAALALY